jgi:hypothetical protein
VLQTLRTLDESDFAETASSFSQPYADYADLDSTTFTPYNLPSVLVPPEVIELDGLSTDSGEDAQVKKEEWPEYLLRLFDNDVCPRRALRRSHIDYPVDYPRSQNPRRLCRPHRPFRYPRYIRSKSQRVRPSTTRIPQMDDTGHVQTQTRRYRFSRTRHWEGLAA